MGWGLWVERKKVQRQLENIPPRLRFTLLCHRFWKNVTIFVEEKETKITLFKRFVFTWWVLLDICRKKFPLRLFVWSFLKYFEVLIYLIKTKSSVLYARCYASSTLLIFYFRNWKARRQISMTQHFSESCISKSRFCHLTFSIVKTLEYFFQYSNIVNAILLWFSI